MRSLPVLAIYIGLVVLASAQLASVQAQSLQTDLSGYAKDLVVRSSSFFSGTSYVLNLTRLRTRGTVDYGRDLHAELWLDTELVLGSYLDSRDYALSQQANRQTLTDLDWNLSVGEDYDLHQRLFRAFVTGYLDQTRITVGRQRIAWGTGFVWNPTDLLNPVNPTAIERGEKEGVDAAYVTIPLGALSQVEAATAPGREWDNWSTAGRISTNWRQYDLSLMGGHFRERRVIGGDFAGYLGGAGLRGEAAYHWPDHQTSFLRAVANVDYTSSSGYYLMLELYYNGAGTRSPSAYDYDNLLAGRTFSLAKEYGALLISKSVTPLFTAQWYNLFNFDDQSGLAGPSVTYSLSEDLEISLSTYLFYGSPQTEYGALANTYFGAVQYYF